MAAFEDAYEVFPGYSGRWECVSLKSGMLGELEFKLLHRSPAAFSGSCCFCRIPQASSGLHEPKPRHLPNLKPA